MDVKLMMMMTTTTMTAAVAMTTTTIPIRIQNCSLDKLYLSKWQSVSNKLFSGKMRNTYIMASVTHTQCCDNIIIAGKQDMDRHLFVDLQSDQWNQDEQVFLWVYVMLFIWTGEVSKIFCLFNFEGLSWNQLKQKTTKLTNSTTYLPGILQSNFSND